VFERPYPNSPRRYRLYRAGSFVFFEENMSRTKLIVIGYNDKSRKQGREDSMSLVSSGPWLVKHRGYDIDIVRRLD
jgi:hypothetical protein